jgi:hypothetical protein
MKQKLSIGDRLRVEWVDYVGMVNGSLSDAQPARAWSEGVLVKDAPDFLVIATSQFVDAKGNPDPKDPEGDYTVLIKGGIQKITKLK